MQAAGVVLNFWTAGASVKIWVPATEEGPWAATMRPLQVLMTVPRPDRLGGRPQTRRAARSVEELPVGGLIPTASPPDPASMLQTAVELLSPAEAARQLPWIISEMTKIATGQSELEYGAKDARFKDRTWTANPAYRGLGLTYRLFEEWAGRMAAAVDSSSWEQNARASYLANIMTAALAPTNFLPTNPAALKRAFETGGLSLFSGAQNMLRDLASGGMPKMVDRDAMKVGEQLACTPGAVVYRDEMFELLEYAPKTPTVRSRPLLMVPPETQPVLRARPLARAQHGRVRGRERPHRLHGELAQPGRGARARELGL